MSKYSTTKTLPYDEMMKLSPIDRAAYKKGIKEDIACFTNTNNKTNFPNGGVQFQHNSKYKWPGESNLVPYSIIKNMPPRQKLQYMKELRSGGLNRWDNMNSSAFDNPAMAKSVFSFIGSPWMINTRNPVDRTMSITPTAPPVDTPTVTPVSPIDTPTIPPAPPASNKNTPIDRQAIINSMSDTVTNMSNRIKNEGIVGMQPAGVSGMDPVVPTDTVQTPVTHRASTINLGAGASPTLNNNLGGNVNATGTDSEAIAKSIMESIWSPNEQERIQNEVKKETDEVTKAINDIKEKQLLDMQMAYQNAQNASGMSAANAGMSGSSQEAGARFSIEKQRAAQEAEIKANAVLKASEAKQILQKNADERLSGYRNEALTAAKTKQDMEESRVKTKEAVSTSAIKRIGDTIELLGKNNVRLEDLDSQTLAELTTNVGIPQGVIEQLMDGYRTNSFGWKSQILPDGFVLMEGTDPETKQPVYKKYQMEDKDFFKGLTGYQMQVVGGIPYFFEVDVNGKTTGKSYYDANFLEAITNSSIREKNATKGTEEVKISSGAQKAFNTITRSGWTDEQKLALSNWMREDNTNMQKFETLFGSSIGPKKWDEVLEAVNK